MKNGQTARANWEKKYKTIQERQMLLKKVTTELLSTLNISEAVQKIAGFVVPYLGDFCHISLLDENDELEEILGHHLDEHNARLLEILRELHEKASLPIGSLNVVRTGKQEFFPDNRVALQKLKEILPEAYRYAAELNTKSYLAVPITVSGKTLGAVAFGSLKVHFTKDELHFAQQLADMIALVMENKSLHREVQETVVEHKNRELQLISESERKWTALAKENERLYEKAQTAVAMRNTFISIASHELRTPITSVKMYSQFIKRLYERSREKGLLDYFDRMDTQVNRMSSLLSDLLSVSRIERGKLDYEMGMFSGDEVIAESIAAIQAKGHEIIVEGKIGKEVYGDPGRIKEVMVYLLNNAVKYSPDAGKVIIRLSPEEKRALITVQDFGIGIDKKHFALIFKPFQRLVAAEGKAIGSAGMGIGLYVANAIVKHHGSKITVESERGKGSTFSFTLGYVRAKVQKRKSA